MTQQTPLQLAMRALDGTVRGNAGMGHIRDYIDVIFSWFDPSASLTDEETDFLCFLASLRQAVDPEGDSPFRLRMAKRREGRGAPPLSPSLKRSRDLRAVTAALIADGAIARSKAPKQAEWIATQRTGVSRAEIHKARKLSDYLAAKERAKNKAAR